MFHAFKHIPSALVPYLRPFHWLSFLPDPVGQTVLKGSPSVRPRVAPPAGWLQCWPEHLSLPKSSALKDGGGKTAKMEGTVKHSYTNCRQRPIRCVLLIFTFQLLFIKYNRIHRCNTNQGNVHYYSLLLLVYYCWPLVAVIKEQQLSTFSQLHFQFLHNNSPLVQLVILWSW